MNRRKTEAEKKITGNPGLKKIQSEIELTYRQPTIPKNLNKAERRIYKRLAPDLIKLRKLNQITQPSFTNYCILQAKIEQIGEFLNKHNGSLLQETRTIDGAGIEHIDYKESAYSRMLRQYSQVALSYLKKFGLTPDEMRGTYHFQGGEKSKKLTIT